MLIYKQCKIITLLFQRVWIGIRGARLPFLDHVTPFLGRLVRECRCEVIGNLALP